MTPRRTPPAHRPPRPPSDAARRRRHPGRSPDRRRTGSRRPTPRRSASTRATSSRPTASTCTSPTATGCASSRSPTHEVVGEPELPNGSHQLLLDGDRLLVVTSSWTGSADTIVSLFDVTDPTNADAAAPLAPRGVGRRHPLGRRRRPTRDHDDVRSAAPVRPAEPVRPRRGPCARAQPADHRRVLRRGLAATLVRRGGGRHVRPDAADPRLQHGGRSRRLRRDSGSRGSPRSTCSARRPRSAPPASCRPATSSTPRPTTCTSRRRTGTGSSGRCRPTTPRRTRPTTSSTTAAADADPPVRSRRRDDGHVRRLGLGARPAAQPVRDERVQRRPAGGDHHRRLELRRAERIGRLRAAAERRATSTRSGRSAGSARPSRSVPSASSATPPTS